MPVIIENDGVAFVSATGDVKDIKNVSLNHTPKFFEKSLTGKGGKSKGLLNEERDPKMFPNGYAPCNINMKKGTEYNKDIKIINIPCNMISNTLWDYIKKYERPDDWELTEIATKGKDEKVYLYMPLHCIKIEETRDMSNPNNGTNGVLKRTLSAAMHMFVFFVKDPNKKEHIAEKYLTNVTQYSKDNSFYRDITFSMFSTLQNLEHDLSNMGYTTDKDAMNNFVQNYSIYDELCKASERWQTKADTIIVDTLIKNILDYAINNYTTNPEKSSLWNSKSFSVAEMLSRLESYNVPLEQYKSMYDKMKSVLPENILRPLCKSNLNLLLSDTLNHLDQNKAILNYCPNNVPLDPNSMFSREQRGAIESTAPLTLVQSGAGTGKSSVILGRIDHMIENGINPSDITVLSFTNAAADHITDLKPTVHSMTIAKMLHTIYAENYPTHQLSTISTIINSLDIFFPHGAPHMTPDKEEFIRKFKYSLERLRDNNEYTQANNFVEEHMDEVLNALDVMKQTSLELESIICYQKIDTLTEPNEVKTKHLIIDEVQDNSIAEFIYSIKYTDKHNCSMFIVGDCSQTLYEFRSSNPKALNVLEGSGVFDTYKLQTNYRSNQEILDFANVLLGNIEANQYANIQLKANSLRPVTKASFENAVKHKYERLTKTNHESLLNDFIPHAISVTLKDYIADKVAKNEQICFLTATRAMSAKIGEILGHIYPGKNIVSMVPKRQYDSALFSKFVAKYWSNIKFTPPKSIIRTIRAELMSKLQYMTYKNATAFQTTQNIARTMFDDFEAQHGNLIKSWEQQVAASIIPQDKMLNNIRELMLEFEIKRNSIAQAVLSAKNAELKNTNAVNNADFVLSTIHSAKGLEFDNVVIIYRNESDARIEESTKRMYYVAFTRAKKTEFIVSYDTAVNPKIEGDYKKIIMDLEAKDKMLAKQQLNDFYGTNENKQDLTPEEIEKLVAQAHGKPVDTNNTDGTNLETTPIVADTSSNMTEES